MSSDSDKESDAKKDSTTPWKSFKLGVASASKSIFKTPAQNRLARLRAKLAEEQKNSQNRTEKFRQTFSSDIVRMKSKNALDGVKLVEELKLKSKTSSVQARLTACLKKPSNGFRVAPIPATEICNQLTSLKPINNTDHIAKSSYDTEESKKELASASSSLLTANDQNENHPKTLNRIRVARKHKSIKIKPPQQSSDLPSTEIKKTHKRKSNETETSITEKIKRQFSEAKSLVEDETVNVREQLPAVKPLQLENNSVKENFSANDRLQRLRDVLKKQKVKKPKDKPRYPTSENTASDNKAIEHFKFPSHSFNAKTPTESPVEQMDVDMDEPVFTESQKTDNVASTSLSSNLASFFQSFRNQIANAFTHNENINIKEQYNKVINTIKSKTEISEQDCVYVIPDTNIFIDHLTFIKDIVKSPVKNNKTVRIFVPYVVIEELDYLKEKKDKAVSTTAMRAVKYLNEMLEERNVSIRGQTIVDSMDHIIPIKYPDDNILNCCFQMKRKGNKFLLLSNDINLRNKALVNGMKALASLDVDVNDLGLLLSSP